MPLEQKIKVVFATVTTLSLMIAVPVYAWLAHQNEIAISAQYSTGNYIMLPALNIRDKITGTDCKINVSAAIDIDYSASQASRESEFPSRPLNYGASYNQVGVNVSMASNLAYENSEAKLAYSNMTAEPAIKSTKYYYINETDKATLVYNAVPKIDTYDKDGYLTENKSQLGLNPKNSENALTSIPIETIATYNAFKVGDLDNANYIRYKFKLFKKTGSAADAEYQQVEFSDYFNSGLTLSDMNIISSISEPSNSGKDVIYYGTINKTALAESSDKVFSSTVTFDVKTGDGFNNYANYRVRLYVDLMTDKNDANSVLPQSSADDWIVYTNAKLDPSMIK